ncbi:MAG TPA: hypothetical protein VGL53_13670 [Bryobacteraceae bacterium]
MNACDAAHHQILHDLYVQACGDLLSAYGLTVQIQKHPGSIRAHHAASYVSVLSATGEGIRLSSMFKIDRDLVASLHPLGPDGTSQADLEDWCRELNNQLVGRVKNKLLGYGRIVMVGIPVLLMGTNVNPVGEANSEIREYSVESAQGEITLTLSTLLAHDVELWEEQSSPADDAMMAEGMIALF